jgi:hypothetical protein
MLLKTHFEVFFQKITIMNILCKKKKNILCLYKAFYTYM